MNGEKTTIAETDSSEQISTLGKRTSGASKGSGMGEWGGGSENTGSCEYPKRSVTRIQAERPFEEKSVEKVSETYTERLNKRGCPGQRWGVS